MFNDKRKLYDIKKCFDEFEEKKHDIFKKNPICEKLYSVEFKILYSSLKSLNKEFINLGKRKPGPLIVFNFIGEKYLLLRFESLCVIIEISIANQFQPYLNTDYLPIQKNEIGMLNKLYSSLNLKEMKDQYFFNLDNDFSSNQISDLNEFLKMTFQPLLWYSIQRFNYPRKKFQDPSFFDFNLNLKMQDNKQNQNLLNRVKKKHGPIKLEMEDFFKLQSEGSERKVYIKSIYIPTMNIFYIKNYVVDNYHIDKEIKFFEHNDFWLFVKCIGYYHEKSINSNKRNLIYEYMPYNMSKYIDKSDDYHRLITFMRIAYCFDYLHSNGYVFSNLKDNKILFDNEGLAYLSSFGFCWNINDDNSDNDVCVPLYMAPEQSSGIHGFESDVYSFGRLTIRLFNKKLSLNGNKLNRDFGYLNDIVLNCLKTNKNERPTMKFIVNKINNIIDTFPINNEDRQRAKDYNKYLKYGSRKFFDGKSLFNSNDDFLNQLFDINIYKIDSIETDFTIMDSLFNNSFTPFITLDIIYMNGFSYLVIGFELSCLCVRISILKEKNNFYLNQLYKVIDSKVLIFPVSDVIYDFLCSKVDININSNIKNDVNFYEMIKNCVSLSKNRLAGCPVIVDKLFPSVIGYSIKRFYFTKNQFNDPYFFNYEEFQKKLNGLNKNDFYLLKNCDENRYIVYNLTHQQLFMVIKNSTKYYTAVPESKEYENNPCLIKYIGYRMMAEEEPETETVFYLFFEFASDYSLRDYLNQESSILENSTIRTKIIIDILFCYYSVNKEFLRNKDSNIRVFVNTNYIFYNQLNSNVKIAFPIFYKDEMIEENIMNIGLILLSLYFCGKYKDLSLEETSIEFKKKCQEIIEKYSIPKDDFPFYYIFYLCFNYKKEINDGYDLNFLTIDIIRLIYKYIDIFKATNQSVILNEFSFLFKNKTQILNESNFKISIKSSSEEFFKYSQLPDCIKDLTVYHLHKGEGILFIQEILQKTKKNSPLATFYLDKIGKNMLFILAYQRTLIIYYMSDVEAFVNHFLINWKNKTLFALDENSLTNFTKNISPIYNEFNLILDEKLKANIPKISSNFYHQNESYLLQHKSFQVVILYLIKRFEFNSNEFEDPSFFQLPFDSFIEFNLNDFIDLSLIGHGSTSNINIVIHKEKFHLFAIKSFTSDFEEIFMREKEFYSKTFNDPCPFITKCYGYIRETVKLVFEYMSKGSLDKIRVNKLVDDTLNTKIMLRILAALNYLHMNNMVYKDLKPENILFNQDLEPFLSDLGAITGNDKITNTFGNLLFAAPEFFKKEKIKYPNKIDIYSFGIMLYYICSDNEDLIKKSNFQIPEKLPKKYNIFQEMYRQCMKIDPRLRLDSTDLLFDIIYYERYFPGTNKNEIKSLIDSIIVNNYFKNKDIYKPFFYSKGISVNKDIEYSLKLAEEFEGEIIKNDYLLFELGNLYFNEFNNKDKAIEFYKMAEKRDDLRSINILGILYFKGDYFEKNISKSLEYFNRIKENSTDALNNYGYVLLFGSNNPSKEDERIAIRTFLEAINEHRKKESYLNLADFYLKNYKNNPVYMNKAIDYYLYASELYYDVAFIKLALLSIAEDGLIESKDANYYFKKALSIKKDLRTYRIIYNQCSNIKFKCDDDLYSDCLLNLNLHFQLSEFCFERNKLSEAKKYFLLDIKKSKNPHSQNYLGYIYFKEEIKNGYLTKNSQSLKYFKKAAKDKQNIISQYNLGLIYFKYSNYEISSIRKSIHFFKNAAVKGHFKANLCLGKIYENVQNIKRAALYYEEALKINKKSAFLLNKLGIFHSIGKGVNFNFDTAKEKFSQASEMNYISARNNYAVLLMNFSKREKDIKEAYGVFFGLQRDQKFILASCNIGLYYESHQRLDDSIPFFCEALVNFKKQFLEKNVLFENEEEQECLNLTVFLVYLIVLNYFLNDEKSVYSKSLFNHLLNDLLTFYQKYRFYYIIEELYFKYEIDQKNRINIYLNDYVFVRNDLDKEFQFDFRIKVKFSHILVDHIKILKEEIKANNYEVLFCSRKKVKHLEKVERIFTQNLNVKPDKTILSVTDLLQKTIFIEPSKYKIQSPIYLKFNHLYPNEVILNDIYSKINFVFYQILDLQIYETIQKISQNAKYLLFDIKYNNNQVSCTILINNYFFYSIESIDKQYSIFQVLSLLSNVRQIDTNSVNSIIGKEYDPYLIFIDNLILGERDNLKNYFITQISYYSLLFHRFNSSFDVSNESKFEKFDSLDLIKLRKIKNNVYKVMHFKTNQVFRLKEIESKKSVKNEIQFYSEFKLFQTKSIVPRLFGKIENENSLLFEYFDNFSDFVNEKWNLLDDTTKTVIFIKIILLINYLHSNGFTLLGLQLDSFLIREGENGNYDLVIDDLYHFLDIDYTVELNSEFTSPEIKFFNQKENLPISYHSDIFSIGIVAAKLYSSTLTSLIINICLSSNYLYRPNSLFLLIYVYYYESYLPMANHDIVNLVIKLFIADKKLFGNQNNRCDIEYLIENNERLKNIKTSLKDNDFDILIALLHGRMQGYLLEFNSLKIRDFFSSDESFAEFLAIANDF